METLKYTTSLLLLALFMVNPAHAGLESCRDPTPDEQLQLDLCSAHAGCLEVTSMISGCASITKKIKKWLASEKPELDPGEYKSERYAPPDASDLEQARKNKERLSQANYLAKSKSRQAYIELVVLDRSIKARLEKECQDPLKGYCRSVVLDAELLASRVNDFNSNADYVALQGKLTVESPAIAAPYGKLQEAAQEEFNRKMEEHKKSMREMDEKRPTGARQAETADTTTAVLKRRGSNSGAEMIQGAINQADQEERDRPAREARKRAEMARAAEQKRIEEEQAAANARAYEQQQAQKREEDSRDTAAALSTLLGTIATIEQGKADRAQARQEEQQRQLRAQQEQQRRANENRKGMDNAHQSTQGSSGYNACLKEGDIGCEAARTAPVNRNVEPVNNQSAYQALQERRVAEANQQIRQQEERYRLARQQAEIDAKRRAEQDKYYAPLTCTSMSSKRYGNGTIHCMQNNCGRTIEANHSGGMSSVSAGSCYSQFSDTVFYAACEKNNGFDRSRNQCVR